ncbi:MAG: hypothetical protein BJ554DRAFT_5813 [Olpidium bornovanus]|uniref:Uncharacterized protein n=1 Tax=Olpidium bornovanus TaxID=278681 RepID=A0A8H7ZYS8_9FUNG|nr:MAG: hypothetical protein BJ554DRAFT_5813 [Olpidium bornovanus]
MKGSASTVWPEGGMSQLLSRLSNSYVPHYQEEAVRTVLTSKPSKGWKFVASAQDVLRLSTILRLQEVRLAGLRATQWIANSGKPVRIRRK